ncbi:MAG: TrkA family potassium uptake protein [bacterium]|nr:TrkA family potassium uptake protein [bacterium]
MYIVVVGGGKVGYNLTKVLLAEGHEVLVVEKDPARYAKLSEELGETVMLGDGAELETLKVMGTNRADVLVATTGSDEDNLIICQMAKIVYFIPKTIARVNDPKNEEVMQMLGIDVTVNSTRIINTLIEEKVDSGMLIPLLSLKGGNVEIVKTDLSKESPVVNQPIMKIQLPKDCILIAVIREKAVIIPKGDTVLKSGDTIIAILPPASREPFRELFY